MTCPLEAARLGERDRRRGTTSPNLTRKDQEDDRQTTNDREYNVAASRTGDLSHPTVTVAVPFKHSKLASKL